MKVRGAVLREMGRKRPFTATRPLEIEALELEAPGAGEVLVQVLAAGLCHSDLSVIDASRPRAMPMVLGHEACGEIVETGPDCGSLRKGDRVVLAFVPSCGECASCSAGRPALCEPGARANVAGTLLSGARRWRDGGDATLHHHLGVSAFAEYSVVSARSVVRVDTDIDPAIAALFGCAVMTGVGAVVNTAQVRPGDSVAVFGLGGVGLAALLGAAASGAHPLIAVDVLPAKLELARACGATHTVLATDEQTALADIRAASGGGVRFAIETVGAAQALTLAYAATRRGGTTVTAGLPHPSQQFAVSAVSLVVDERTVKGSYMGSCVPARDVPRFMALYRAGRLPVERLLTHRLRLDELNAGFERLACGEAVRQIVTF
jgi:Zn-dependent alcohol dehydrogenase